MGEAVRVAREAVSDVCRNVEYRETQEFIQEGSRSMSTAEEYQGFVPVVILLASQHIEGRVWKFANRRLLQQIEQDKREFVPVVEARLYACEGEERRLAAEYEVLAVRKSAIIAIEPLDTVTQVAER